MPPLPKLRLAPVTDHFVESATRALPSVRENVHTVERGAFDLAVQVAGIRVDVETISQGTQPDSAVRRFTNDTCRALRAEERRLKQRIAHLAESFRAVASDIRLATEACRRRAEEGRVSARASVAVTTRARAAADQVDELRRLTGQTRGVLATFTEQLQALERRQHP